MVLRIDGPDELDLDALGDARSSGSPPARARPRTSCSEVIDTLAPTEGVELVHVTDEDEYFPPPRELRELLPALDALVTLMLGGRSVGPARRRGGPFSRRPLGRRLDCVLEALAGRRPEPDLSRSRQSGVEHWACGVVEAAPADSSLAARP